MKKKIIKSVLAVFVFFSLLCPNTLNSKTLSSGLSDLSIVQQNFDKEIINAISTANTQLLSKYFFTNIELSLPSVQGSYSKTQAEFIIKNFFNNNPPASFSIINEGLSGGEKSRFFLGNYVSTNGNKYRVYYLCKEIAGKNVITILKFE